MIQTRLRAITCAATILLLASTAFAQDARDTREARGLVESVAAGLYALAWPTATYKTWALKEVRPVAGGLDIVTKLAGASGLDSSDLWVELLLEVRGDGIHDLRVIRHNAFWVPPFATSGAIAGALAHAIDDYNRSKSTAPPAPAAAPRSAVSSSRGVGLCLVNPTDYDLVYSFRWGDGSWGQTTVKAHSSWWHSYPLAGSGDAAPIFRVQFDNDFAEGFTASQFTLTPSSTPLPLECASVYHYEFHVTRGSISLVAP